ncbi:MAG: hypothetical protein ABJZ62_01135 [Hyphomicrobiales bacterium]
MSEVLQVKTFASGMGSKKNEKDTNAFLASMDPSQIVNVMSVMGSAGSAHDFGAQACCVILYKTKADALDPIVMRQAQTDFGGVFSSEEAK